MADTTFVNGTTLTDADWFNDVNRLHYTIFGDPADVAAVKDALHSAPGAIGDATPSTGAFTTITSTGGIQTTGAVLSGYGTGAGGAVTQATDRTTAVTLNKPCGAITLVSAAGSATWASFLVNNSLVAATDTIELSVQGSGATNTYVVSAAGVSAGAFYIVFATTGGTATDAPIINFAVKKAVTS